MSKEKKHNIKEHQNININMKPILSTIAAIAIAALAEKANEKIQEFIFKL